jgi:hypothetical protein
MRRIAHRQIVTETLFCNGLGRKKGDGWSFPAKVDRLLRKFVGERSALHLFGGKAQWGVRLDIDESVKPDFVGDAFNPPFERDEFDVVVMDPPYVGTFAALNQQTKNGLFKRAAWIAREHVIWFHPMWVSTDRSLPLEKAFMVCPGDFCKLRALQIFRVVPSLKTRPEIWKRGPGLKYNRWITQPNGLFGEVKTL